jgi:hypothetical protein
VGQQPYPAVAWQTIAIRDHAHPEKVLYTVSAPSLAGLDLSEKNLGNAGLRSADLRGTNFSKANLVSADLENADLSQANLAQAVLTGVHASGARFVQANLANARLSTFHLFFQVAELRGADFSGANLTGVDFSGAELMGANLTGANLTGANLSGANLTGANLSGARINEVEYNEKTRWPVGFRPWPSVKSWPTLQMERELALDDSDEEGASFSPSGAENKSNDNCYIATACYGSIRHPDVIKFRNFRDECLLKWWLGRRFIVVYYRLSPLLVRWMSPRVAALCRHRLLEPLARRLRGKGG